MSAGYELALALKVRGPILSQATGEPRFGLDAAQIRAGGRPIMPGSHVKGHLRQVFEQARVAGVPGIDDCWIGRWLGRPSGRVSEPGGSRFEPENGLLTFSDLVADSAKCGAITRVAIDEERGGVRQGMMQVVEAPWAYGETVIFRGKARLHGVARENDREHLRQSLAWAFQMIPAVGAFKTAGFGRLEKATMAETWETLPAMDTAIDADAIVAAGGADLRLIPHEPFLVWSSFHGGNFIHWRHDYPRPSAESRGRPLARRSEPACR